MNPFRVLARPLLAAGFIWSGVEQLRNAKSYAAAAAPVVEKIAERNDLVPDDPELLVKVNGGVMVAAGVLFARGSFPRAMSLVLTGTMAAATATAHRFWEETDPKRKALQTQIFAKNVALVGAALLATTGPTSNAGQREMIRNLSVKSAQLAAANAGLRVQHATDVAARKAAAV